MLEPNTPNPQHHPIAINAAALPRLELLHDETLQLNPGVVWLKALVSQDSGAQISDLMLEILGVVGLALGALRGAD